MGRCGVDASSSGYGHVTGYCEQGSESSISIKGEKFID
jgi:hypothetical protein